MEEFIYIIDCKRTSEIGSDWYVVNPVYSDAERAYEKAEECTKKYSVYTDKNGVVWNQEFFVEKIKLSKKESE